MASPAQIAANRRNAQHSTGPRTDEGKAAVRLNSLIHGLRAQEVLLPDEDPAVFEELRESFHQQFNPEGPAELFCVEKMLLSFWRNRRIGRIEADMYRHFYPTAAQAGKIGFGTLGQSFTIEGLGQDNFSRLARYETSLDRSFYRASKELQTLRKVRIGFARQNEEAPSETPKAEISAASGTQPATPVPVHPTTSLPDPIGFARQNEPPKAPQPAAATATLHRNRRERRQARLQASV